MELDSYFKLIHPLASDGKIAIIIRGIPTNTDGHVLYNYIKNKRKQLLATSEKKRDTVVIVNVFYGNFNKITYTMDGPNLTIFSPGNNHPVNIVLIGIITIIIFFIIIHSRMRH